MVISIDYYGNWKLLQYQVKEDYRDLAVLEVINQLNKEQYYLSGTGGDKKQGTVTSKIFNLKGQLIYSESRILRNE